VDTAHGLPAARLSALSVLVFVGPQTVGSLARHEQVTPATISKLLDRLEADGLCRRTRSRADRRVVTVSASPAGKRLLQGARRRRVERLASGLRSLSDVELGTLRRSAALVEGVVRRGSEDRA
jgi:DNA-binding MarR family transcriptional regulator